MTEPTTRTRFVDVETIEVEHLLSETNGGLVKIRVVTDAAVIALGQLEPDAAREIARNLTEAAARSEYEQDLYTAASAAELPREAIAMMLSLVRYGEMSRHEMKEES